MSIEELELHPQFENVVKDKHHVARYSAAELSYNDFYWSFMKPNWPVILTDVSNNWECRINWTTQISNCDNSALDICSLKTAIDFEYLRIRLGNNSVPVADCTTEYYNSHATTEIPFHDFLESWQNNCSLGGGNTTKYLYLKDWHLKAQMPEYDFYHVPKQFASDWLNEQLIATGRDDYRFVYMGPKKTWTPFHTDVFGSFSWSTNIAGCKKWILLPPGEELKLADRRGNLPFCIDEAFLAQKKVEFYELMQSENEAIFVPSGWYHQVWNLTDTISVNHNWFNACNVKRIWHNLSTSMKKVIAEIEDCRKMDDFDAHCQMMLRASFGMNVFDFLDLLEFIAKRRVTSFTNGNTSATIDQTVSSTCLSYDLYSLNDFHIRYDLQCIQAVLNLMLKDVVCDSSSQLYRRYMRLVSLIKEF